jgi:hypothetical protein
MKLKCKTRVKVTTVKSFIALELGHPTHTTSKKYLFDQISSDAIKLLFFFVN